MTAMFRNDKLVLFAILCVALILRIIGLNQPLWYDELLTLYTHLRLPWSEMMVGYEMNHHYLYSFQAKLLMGLWGESAWVLRLPALFFGVASVWLIWVLVRQVSETRYAHITAGLLALSYHHIWFSQNARGYTELMFWCVLGLILFLKGVSTPTRSTWIGFAIVLALAVFTHLTGFFFFFAIGVIWLAWSAIGVLRGRLEFHELKWPSLGFILGGVFCLILYAPILGSVFENAATVGETSAVDAMKEFQNPVWTVLETVRTLVSGLGSFVGIIALAVLVLCALGSFGLWRRAALFPLVIWAHIGLTMALLYALGMRIWPRFFFVDIGFLFALIVFGVAWVSTRLEAFIPALPKTYLFRLGVVGMFVISAGLATQNYRAPKQDIPGPIDLIEENLSAGEAVYAVGYVGGLYVDHIRPDWELINSSETLATAIENPASKWLVIGFPARSFREIEGLSSAIDGFELVKRFPGTLGDGDMLDYRQKS